MEARAFAEAKWTYEHAKHQDQVPKTEMVQRVKEIEHDIVSARIAAAAESHG